MSLARLTLRAGKERPLQQRHHWIYSGAIAKAPTYQDGDILPVHAHSGEKLGLAMMRSKRSIMGHMIAFGEQSVDQALRENIRRAHQLRKRWVNGEQTNAWRLVHAEGDGIPGLIVDVYNDVLVLQISHPGIEQLKPNLLSILREELQPRSIFEKSTSAMRQKEGFAEVRAHLWGDPNPEVEVLENGLRYAIHVLDGQKTGFFLDQREMRAQIRSLSRGKRVLNVFSYTGAFSVAAFAGGAESVDSVETGKFAVAGLEKNLKLNSCPTERHGLFAQDAFFFLKESPLAYDIVILDPPAFAKKQGDIENAFRAYKELNRMVMAKLPAGSLLLTCSCSYHISDELFQNILFRAAHESGRSVQIVGQHRLALDHPISLFHPESAYLKSRLLFII